MKKLLVYFMTLLLLPTLACASAAPTQPKQTGTPKGPAGLTDYEVCCILTEYRAVKTSFLKKTIITLLNEIKNTLDCQPGLLNHLPTLQEALRTRGFNDANVVQAQQLIEGTKINLTELPQYKSHS